MIQTVTRLAFNLENYVGHIETWIKITYEIDFILCMCGVRLIVRTLCEVSILREVK